MDLQPTANKPPVSQPKPLSCTNCRARKLKCSREHPCSHCVRSGAECVFPTRKRIRKPRKNKNSELLQRLSRLESIVSNVSLAALSSDDIIVSGPGPSTSPSPAARPPVESVSKQAQATPSGARDDWQKALQASKASRYLSGEFWSSLCVEVEGLRQALEQSTDSSEDEQQPSQEATPESATDNNTPSAYAFSPGMLLGSSSHSSSEHIEHPTHDQIRFLTSTFFTNVDMILKILHRPTIETALLAFADAQESARPQLAPEREVLFFSIYHAAVASLPASTCLTYLGYRRDDLMRAYSSAVEHLLVRADYLNSTSLETLQALTLFVACVRSSRGSKAAWALLSLPIRLAQGLNLHRESSNTYLSPYEAELRRRLWWQLIVLDIRASEDRGTKTIVGLDSWDTRLPLNINDADFGPDSCGPLVEREGPTDMTFYLCTAHCSNLFLRIEHAQGAPGANNNIAGECGGGRSTSTPSGAPALSIEETVQHAQALESRFVAGADPNHPPSYLASVMVRLVILKLWLGMQYPVHPRRRPSAPSASRQGAGPGGGQGAGMFPHEATLRTAVGIMELNEYLGNGPYGDRFSWWSNTYVQWHPLAVVLAELCTQTKGELVDRAWRTVEDVFPRWSEVIADTKSGTLWRPIRKLYKKAKEARAAAIAGATGAGTSTTDTAPTGSSIAAPATAAAAGKTRITTITIKDGEVDIGRINVGTNNQHNTARPPEVMDESTVMVATTTEPEGAYGSEIRNTREPSVPPDLNALSMSPYALSESMFGWRDLNLDIPPMLDLGGGGNTMEWSTWDDFVNETQANVDEQSKSGSSETSYY